MRRILLAGVLFWIAGTIGIRLAGEHVLQPEHLLQTLGLYFASFVLMAWLTPRIFRRVRVQKDEWLGGVTVLILPTLLLDPFSCAFFTSVFPNIDARAAGLFGGWMLICCGGAVAGVATRRWR